MSSATSTDPATARRRQQLFWGVPVALVALFACLLIVVYDFRFTFATLFWLLGWASFVVTGALLYKAATAFSGEAVDDRDVAAMTDQRRAELEREKKVLLKAIKEIEFDQAMGKIDAHDAEEIVGTYRARAREILKALEGEQQTDWQTIAEKELARRLARAGVEAPAAVTATEPAPVPVCGACATKNETDAKFCKSCGAKLG